MKKIFLNPALVILPVQGAEIVTASIGNGGNASGLTPAGGSIIGDAPSRQITTINPEHMSN